MIETKYHHYLCLQCGEVFFSTNPPITLYCSKECEDNAKKAKEYMSADCFVSNPYDLDTVETYICKQCGESFIADKGSGKEFCNATCEKIYKKEHNEGRYVCSECGAEFVKVGRKKLKEPILCRKCHYKKRPTKEYTCEICGKVFQSQQPAKYCSKPCYNKAQSLLKKQARSESDNAGRV